MQSDEFAHTGGWQEKTTLPVNMGDSLITGGTYSRIHPSNVQDSIENPLKLSGCSKSSMWYFGGRENCSPPAASIILLAHSRLFFEQSKVLHRLPTLKPWLDLPSGSHAHAFNGATSPAP